MSQNLCEDRSKGYAIGLVVFFRANAYYVESIHVYGQGVYILSLSRFKKRSFFEARIPGTKQERKE